MRSFSREESAASEVVGTMMLIGVAVAFVAIVAFELGSAAPAGQVPLRLETSAAPVSPDSIELLHLGGATLVRGDLRIVVGSPGTVLDVVTPSQPTASWGLGDTLLITTSAPLPPGEIEITVAHATRGILATTGARVSGGPGAGGPALFTVTPMLDGSPSPPTVPAPSQVLIEATVAHSEGRKFVRQVHADLTELTGPPWVPLRDDGTRGDRVAGDGTWSGVLSLPFTATPGPHDVHVFATDLDGDQATAAARLFVV